jgi:hypothetical protein
MFRSSSFCGPVPALTAIVAAACLTLPSVRAATPEPYAADAAYTAGAVVLGADGNAYRAAADVKGSDPVTSGGDAWRLAHAASDLVIDVPGRFKTIGEAWAFLAGARIAETATVTIELAPGELGHNGPLVLNHAEGARLVLRGAGDKPEECRLLFDGSDGIVVDRGHSLTIENLTIKSARAGGTGFGLVVNNRSTVTASACRFENFGVIADGNSHLVASRCEFMLTRPGDGFVAKNGSSAVLTDCIALGKLRAKEGIGFLAYNGGTLFCVGCRAEGWNSGFKVQGNGAMHLERCVGRENGIGASSWFSGSMNVMDCVFANNEQVGVAAIFATAGISDSQLTDNGIAGWAIGNAYLQFLGKPTTISGSRIGVEAKAGGRVDMVGKPIFKNVAMPLSVGAGPGHLPLEQAFVNAP